MGSEWREVRLGDVVEIFDGPHATPHTVDEGPIFLGITCLDGGRLDLTKAEHLTETDFARWTRRVTPRSGDVVFSYETRIGEAARIPPSFRGCLGRRMGLLRPKPNVDPSFLLYAYLAPEFQETLRSRTIHGSTVDRIPLVQLGDFPIRVPPIAEQQMIGSVLAALDDKIDLNRRMSHILDSMAHALFKSWFVDFDPIRAKAEGRDPGLPEFHSDLFPNSFEGSELGHVPAGWPVSSLGDLCSRVAIGPFGSDITVDNFIDSGVPVVRGNNLRDGFLDDEFAFVSPAKADQLRNANAFPGDIIVTHRGTLGQVGLIPKTSRYPRYVASQSQMLASVDTARATAEYLYQYLRSTVGQHALLANVSQTGVPAIARPTTSLRAIRVLAPPLRVQEAFSRFTGTVVSRLGAQLQECHALTLIRANLLERLLSPSPSSGRPLPSA